MTDGSTTWTYTYNADGLRTKRTNGTTTYNYIYNGSSLTQMTVGSDTLYFAYDGSSPMAVTYNGTNYYYATNLQGDVVAILNSSGTAVVQYTYDAWGNILTTTGSMASTLGTINPLTYRGYVFDRDTNLYYLQSRYYNPEIGRFINADVLVTTGQGFIGNNMFTYCLNNPVVFTDSLGMAAANAENISMIWNATMWWLCLADAFLPIGDFIYVGVAIAIPVICTLTLTSSQTDNKADTASQIEAVTTGGGGARDYSVYFLYQRGDPHKAIIYVGRVKTANFDSRMSYHRSKGRMLAAHIDGLTYEECRAIEQAGMLFHHTIGKGMPLRNQINGIGPHNRNAQQYWQAALNLIDSGRYPLFNSLPSSYLRNQAENELLNMGM